LRRDGGSMLNRVGLLVIVFVLSLVPDLMAQLRTSLPSGFSPPQPILTPTIPTPTLTPIAVPTTLASPSSSGSTSGTVDLSGLSDSLRAISPQSIPTGGALSESVRVLSEIDPDLTTLPRVRGCMSDSAGAVVAGPVSASKRCEAGTVKFIGLAPNGLRKELCMECAGGGKICRGGDGLMKCDQRERSRR